MKGALTNQLKQPGIKRKDIPDNVAEVLSKRRYNLPMNAAEQLVFKAWQNKRRIDITKSSESDVDWDSEWNQ